MATADSTPISLLAGADLTGKLYYFGKQSSAGIVVCSVAGEAAHVIIASEPNAADKAVDGWAERSPKVLAGGTFAKGDNLTTTAAGKAVVATAGQTVNAIALEAGVDGRVVKVMRPLAVAVTGDGGYAAVSASGTIAPTAGRVDLTVSGTKAYTLADGNVGHELDILCVSAASTPLGTLTIATVFGSEPTTHLFTTAGQRLRLRMTATGWKVVAKTRTGSQTVVFGTDAVSDMVAVINPSITGTAAATLAAGQVAGERIEIRPTTAASTPVGNLAFTGKALDGTAHTQAQFNATTDYLVATWNGAAWLEEFSSSVTFS